jgi:quercetin dioxygenase-like cupin family protein
MTQSSRGTASWLVPGQERGGRFEGDGHGSAVSFFVVDAAPGESPGLHHHPYSETFAVLAGRGRFEVGGRTVEAAAGDALVVPPGTAHGFQATGPERLRLVAIHAAPRMQTTWLGDGPDA